MNKQALIDAITHKVDLTKVQAEQAIECILDSIVSTLKSGKEVSISGFGIFAAKDRPARIARNPRTGESVNVSATRVPKFRAAKALKEAVK
jgi:DNA-binding protein HU-beta